MEQLSLKRTKGVLVLDIPHTCQYHAAYSFVSMKSLQLHARFSFGVSVSPFRAPPSSHVLLQWLFIIFTAPLFLGRNCYNSREFLTVA